MTKSLQVALNTIRNLDYSLCTQIEEFVRENQHAHSKLTITNGVRLVYKGDDGLFVNDCIQFMADDYGIFNDAFNEAYFVDKEAITNRVVLHRIIDETEKDFENTFYGFKSALDYFVNKTIEIHGEDSEEVETEEEVAQ